MKIVSTSTEQYTRGIPLKGWDSVTNALNIFSRGFTKGSQASQDHQMNALAQSSGAMGLGLYLITGQNMQAPSLFVREMLAEAETRVRSNGIWSKGYDYDGVGVFHKTTVTISVLDLREDLFMLELNAAYVGDVPERGLAEHLGLPLTLRRSSAIAQIDSEDGVHFALDFEPAVQAVNAVLTTLKGVSGQAVAAHFMKEEEFGSPKTFLLFCDQDIAITVAPGQVESRFVYNRGQRTDTWSSTGSVLTGLLRTSYEDPAKKEPATFVVCVQSSMKDRFGYSAPVFQEDIKRLMTHQSAAIAGTLLKI